MRIVLFLFVILSATMQGCRGPEPEVPKAPNPYISFFNSISNPGNEVETPQSVGIEPKVIHYSENPWQDDMAMFENGFEKIGYSSFNGPESPDSEENALEQARRVGASFLMLKNRYLRTKTETVPYTTKNPNQAITTFSSGTASVVGAGGVSSVAGSGTSMAFVKGGSTTIAMPYEIDQFDFLATYWAKRKRFILGARWVDLSQEARILIQQNTGAQVIAVVKGTTAFLSNLLPKDIILKVDEENIINGKHLMELLQKIDKSKPTKFYIQRGSERRIIEIQLS